MALSPGALEQKIDDVARDADEATLSDHGARLTEHERRLNEGVERRNEDRREQVDRKIEATQIRFTPALMLWIVVACGSAFSGQWFMNAGLRSDVSTILSQQIAQREIVGRIQEQQTKDIDDLKKNSRLYDIQIQNLKEEVLNLKAMIKGVK